MAAGNTAAIDAQTLRVQWETYMPMAAICSHWTISKDQLIRLRNVWSLPLRLDRRRRYKPPRSERITHPDDAEIRASESSLSLAPLVAARATCVSSRWSADVRESRQVAKATPYTLARVEVPDHLRDSLEEG